MVQTSPQKTPKFNPAQERRVALFTDARCSQIAQRPVSLEHWVLGRWALEPSTQSCWGLPPLRRTVHVAKVRFAQAASAFASGLLRPRQCLSFGPH